MDMDEAPYFSTSYRPILANIEFTQTISSTSHHVDLKRTPKPTLLPLDCQSAGWSLVRKAFPPGHAASIPSVIPKFRLGS
jgi:hypothetical protein